MTQIEELKKGIQYVAFGYLFLYINLNLGRVNLLPDFVSYILFLEAVKVLEKEERELSLLDNLGRILIVWNLILWILAWFGIDINWQFLRLLFSVVNLYFQFQLLTNLASIAGKYQKEEDFEGRILLCRTLQTLIITAVTVVNCFSAQFTDVWQYVSLVMAAVYLILGVCIIKVLLDLRSSLMEEEIE